MVQVRGNTFALSDFNIVLNTEDKKELRIRVWEKSGIYLIRNNVSNSCYVGLAKNIYKRITYGHIHDLLRNKHCFSNGEPDLLQRAWNSYGSRAFSYEILEYCDAEMLPIREMFWINYFECNNYKTGKGYNLTDGGNFPPPDGRGVKGKRIINNGVAQKAVYPTELDSYFSEGWKLGRLPKYNKELSETLLKKYAEERDKGIHRVVSEDARRKMSEAHYKPGYSGGVPKGFKHSEESKQRMSAWQLSRVNTSESNKKRSETMLAKNLKLTDEQKSKIIKSKERAVLQFSLEGVFIARYESGQKAASATGEDAGYISLSCNNKLKKYKNSIWRFENESK